MHPEARQLRRTEGEAEGLLIRDEHMESSLNHRGPPPSLPRATTPRLLSDSPPRRRPRQHHHGRQREWPGDRATPCGGGSPAEAPLHRPPPAPAVAGVAAPFMDGKPGATGLTPYGRLAA